MKHPDRAEADRFYNYPYEALEEVLSNAVYHKSYELGSPIEIQVLPDKITVLSYPGPMPPVDNQMLKNERRIVAREYRNRRIGDFLKELHLTEGRGTGFPTIYDAMADNGSPEPIFETDGKTYTLATLKIHPEFPADSKMNDNSTNGVNVLNISSLSDLTGLINGATNGATNGAAEQALKVIEKEIHDKVVPILENAVNWVRREDLLANIGLTNQTYNRKKFLDPLLSLSWIQMEYPENQTHPNQRYKITKSGRRLLNMISTK